LSACIAAESFNESPVWIDQIDERRVIISVTAVVRITPLVEHVETLGGHSDLRRRPGQANNARIE